MDATRTQKRVSCAELQVMLHALGLTDPFQVESYRNRFVAGDGHADMDVIRRLCDAGLMQEAGAPGFLDGGDRVFQVTEAGTALARASRKRPGRAQRRYHLWLSLKDVHPDLSFWDFLTSPVFSHERRVADLVNGGR